MSAYRDFQDVLAKLESDRIKERSEGVARCRAFLASKRNLTALSQDQRNSWIQAFQIMFSVVIKERNSSVQKKSAATDKRLEEATQLVRFAAEKLRLLVNRKTAKAITTHLTQMSAINGKLQSYALTYMKALRTFLGYAPHLEHLDERMWTDIVMLCFSAVLGDSVRIGQAFADDVAMDIDDEDGAGPIGALQAKAADEVALPAGTKKTAGPTDIELLGVIEIVFRSRGSPFLTYAQAIFRKFLRFFRLFPSETSAHLSAVVALNRAFAEIDLNDQRSMKRIGPHLWPHLLALWPTKNASLKEQLVVALRYLFPFVVPVAAHAKHTSEREVVARAKALFEAVLSEPTIRWREAYELDIDHLGLGIRAELRTQPFQALTFRIGAGFDDKDAIAWSVAELGADALARIYGISGALPDRRDEEAELLSPVQRGKRRRLDDPLSSLLDTLSDPSLPANVQASRIQLLCFLIDKHWVELSSEARTRIEDALVPLLSASDVQAQRPMRRAREPSGSSRWDQIWQLALRKMSSRTVARTAADLANALLAHDCVSPAVMSDSIEKFVKDLDVQTLCFPSEAVCLFFEWVLAISASDARLVHLHAADKVISWLAGGWGPLDGMHRAHAYGQHRPHADPLSVSSLTSLIGRLSGLSDVTPGEEPYLVPDCPIATMAIELSDTSRIRDYLDAKIPPYQRDGAAHGPKLRAPVDFDATCGAPEDLAHKTPRRISAWLFKTLSTLQEAASSDAHWTNMSVEQVRRHLDLASLALLVEGVFATHDIPPNRRLVREAANLIGTLSPILTLGRWSSEDRARLLSALSPILVRRERNVPPIEYPVLLDPGIASDLPSRLMPQKTVQPATFAAAQGSLETLLAVWKNDEVRRMLDELLAAVRFLLTKDAEKGPSPDDDVAPIEPTQATQRIKALEQTQREDDFEEVRVGSGRALEVGDPDGGSSTSRAAQAVIGSCVDIAISDEMAAGASHKPARLREVLDAIVAALTGDEAIAIAEEAFAAARSGLATIGLAQAEAVLEHIGGELLPDYRFARSERCALVVLQFLECTAHLWVNVDTSHEDFAARVRAVIGWMIEMLRKKTLTAWRVRLWFTSFLNFYLAHDPSQRNWDLHGSAPRSEDTRIITPTTIIPFMLTDADFRVRFLATSSVAKLFELCTVLGLSEDTLFNDIRANMALNVSESELVLTQTLCNANMIIAAGSRRRAPYQLLVRLSAESDLGEVTIATLKGVAERLGFPSLRELYLYYARYLTWFDVRAAQTNPSADLAQRLPYRACGFDTLRDARTADVKRTASWLLQYDEAVEAFFTVCEVIGRTPEEVALDCFGETAALALVMGQPATSRLADRVSQLAHGARARDADQQERLLNSALDEIVAEILLLAWSGTWSPGAPACLKDDSRAAKVFAELTQLPEALVVSTEPPPPHFPPEQVVAAARWLDQSRHVFSTPAIVLCVVQRLLTAVLRAPFVSERYRRLLALALALALGHRSLADADILSLLADGLLTCLPDGDCTALVAPMLAWTIDALLRSVCRSRPGTTASHRLCEQLGQAAPACQAAQRLAREERDRAALDGLSRVLEDSVQKMLEFGESSVAEVVLLWPKELPALASISIDNLYRALTSNFSPADKFTVVSRLVGHPQYQDVLRRPDRGRLVWHLMRSIRSDRSNKDEDCLAFARLLYDLGGEYEAPVVGDPEYRDVETAGVARPETLEGVKKLVLERVAQTISCRDSRSGDAAFHAARLLLSTDDASTLLDGSADACAHTDLLSKLAWPSLRRGDRLRRPSGRSLDELKSNDWLIVTGDADKWAQAFGELVADSLAERDLFFGQLAILIQQSPAFAREACPVLCHAALLTGAATDSDDHAAALSTYFARLLASPIAAVETVGIVVETVMNLRKYAHPDIHAAQPSRFDNWFRLPWLLVAKAASRTGLDHAALLCLELAHEYDHLFASDAPGRASSKDDDEAAQDLLYTIYERIDESDGFYGRESPDVREALVRRYCHEHNWEGAFRTYGAQHESRSFGPELGMRGSPATGGVVEALSSFGFNRLALDIWQPARLSGQLTDSGVDAELPYELAWRTDVWDLPIERGSESSPSAALYAALRAHRVSRSPATAHDTALQLLSSQVANLGRVSLESPTPDRRTLSTILALREVVQADTASASEGELEALSQIPKYIQFENAEKVLSTRNSILRGARNREQVEQVGDDFTSELYRRATTAQAACLLELSRRGRAHGHLQTSLNAVTAVRLVVDPARALKVDEEFAQVLWAQGEHKTAIKLLADVQKRSPQKSALLFSRLGEWTADAQLHGSKEILQEYFDPAARALERNADPDERGQVYAAIAVFADAQQEDLRDVARDRSARFSAYQRRKKIELKEMERRLQDGSLESGDLKRTKRQAEEHLDDDRRQLEEAQQLARDMLWRALDSYAHCLTASDKHDDRIYRFCALWLACADDEDLHARLKQPLANVPSHKFVFLAYQLSARLIKSPKPSPSSANISSLVFRLCTQHSFHSLYPVQSLRAPDAATNASGRFSRRSSTSRESSVGIGSNNSRAQAATDILEKARRNERLRPRIEAVELACAAYAEWASFDLKSHGPYLVNSSDSRVLKKGPLPIAKTLKIKTHVRDLPIPVTTYDLAVDPTGTYADSTFPSIVKYDDYFDTAGGIHLPKIVVCRGSDGVAYKQLFKGDDDIRQDAVMEQAFGLVNSLLARDEGGRRRKLRIRTYKVVPLQNRNGLLEFVRDTVPLGAIFQGLYDKMAPNTIRKARDSLRLIESKYKSSYDRQVPLKDTQFRQILQETPPLFRHHFRLKHKVPALWFDMRLNYSRSVATTSIIGHVVGLGDRHVSNILMDEARGELVHIDLGIAFDQGKRLPIPELVPFRLTQNLVDGFGMNGVEGVFRRCCEETLRVLRERSSVIMTVLEVFKHDPLQNWAVSAEMAKRIQGSSDVDAEALDELPDDADRALAIIRGKLDDRLSVDYTVNKLIQEATDETHLARIFSGWQPYF
ncbi:Serine/threonine-protein kinase tel1 [Rhodotorula sphaerocarpa]